MNQIKVTITGPAGSGKTTLGGALVSFFANKNYCVAIHDVGDYIRSYEPAQLPLKGHVEITIGQPKPEPKATSKDFVRFVAHFKDPIDGGFIERTTYVRASKITSIVPTGNDLYIISFGNHRRYVELNDWIRSQLS